ncbi:isochorismatase [Collibacillus ludicampi]|jgi:nicotinamidase-related amidase|uniref:Isochorismatase n=1 Tax=Collibacillus ludicampi TaxID=2771369 RepID=A0AAV4L9N2_9BACL|nr:cysteine hydrolase family protein [Collibacillus ludicampi]GIM44482.1 isochorismatase [Collibacillus ludicampi]
MKTALLLIDIQNDYFPHGKMELVEPIEASLRAKQILTDFREKGWPVFHIQHISIRQGATFFLPGTDGIKIHENVEPLPDEVVIQKHYPNSFRETDLLSQLQKREINRLVICGMMTHMCIDATTRAAFDYGFECVVIHDACASRNLTFNGETIPAEHVHLSFLAALNGTYARVLGAEEFLRT